MKRFVKVERHYGAGNHHLTVGVQDTDAYIPGYKERMLQEQIQQLVCYLWDNFLQLFETDEIFLMGVGNAYLGVKVLLINRGELTAT